MTTNIPAKNFDTKRITLSATVETGITLEATHVIRYIKAQCATDVNVRISFTPGGTLSTDNYFTIKSGEYWEVNDFTLYPRDDAGTFFYALSETGAVTLEVIWAQA